jgi:hypothetical protein
VCAQILDLTHADDESAFNCFPGDSLISEEICRRHAEWTLSKPLFCVCAERGCCCVRLMRRRMLMRSLTEKLFMQLEQRRRVYYKVFELLLPCVLRRLFVHCFV